jgi:hypothetical protein
LGTLMEENRFRFLTPFSVFDLLDLDHGWEQLTNVVRQLGMAVDVLLKTRPFAGPVAGGELVGDPGEQDVVGGAGRGHDSWSPVGVLLRHCSYRWLRLACNCCFSQPVSAASSGGVKGLL